MTGSSHEFLRVSGIYGHIQSQSIAKGTGSISQGLQRLRGCINLPSD